jgi:hypothetical protein
MLGLRKSLLLPAALAVLLAACDGAPRLGSPFTGSGTDSATVASAALPPVAAGAASARPGDSLASFAATAGVGSTGMVDGQPARLARSYIAASGRECREVVLGAGGGQRAVVACREADGQFVSVRPLLRGAR